MRAAVAILDYGSQYTQVIARRVRDLGVYCEILPHDVTPAQLAAKNANALILSGGPASVHEEGSPSIDPALLDGSIPVLGVCYGMQLMAQVLGGEVAAEGRREYGPADVERVGPSALFDGLEAKERAWMSHGDSVKRLPPGFTVIARTERLPTAAIGDGKTRYGVQFHPEVAHTPNGGTLLANFLFKVAKVKADWTPAAFIDEAVAEIRAQIGEGKHAICGLSGGVDSAVAATLVARAIGDRLTCVFVDTGLLRKDEAAQVVATFSPRVRLVAVDAGERFLTKLAGVGDPERKRKIIGEEFVRVFEEEAAALHSANRALDHLVQGTIYPDVIESKSKDSKTAARIKTHHNVGGLPDDMTLQVVEPLRRLFKDEVRKVGTALGIPDEILWRHPFPGPGLAVRMLGAVDKPGLEILREADAIFIEELQAAGLYREISQAFAVLTPVRSVGVQGDFRTYSALVALRAVVTGDFMTADWARIPYEVLAKVSARIVNEVPGVNRVAYDISSKPPATIEGE